jgi:hypothetical protein
MDALLDPLQCALLTNAPLIILMHLSVSLPPFSVCNISGITAVAKIGIKAFPQVSASLFGKQAT